MTTTDVVVHRAPVEAQGVAIDHEAILNALNLNPRDPKTQALLLICERYSLDPILKHIVLIKGNAYVTRDGYLTVAHRSGQFDGMEVLETGETPTHHTAKVAVYRKDMSHPFAYVGRFPKTKDMAKEFGPEMAVKVAEVQSLRRAFNVTGISAADEMWEDATPTPPPGVDPSTGEVQPTVGTPPPVSGFATLQEGGKTGSDPFRPFDESNEKLVPVGWVHEFRVAMAQSGHADAKVHGAVISYATGGRSRDPRSVRKDETDKVAATHRRLDAGELAEHVDDKGVVSLVDVAQDGAGTAA